MTQKSVTIYTTTSCPYCVYAKEFFDHKKITYKEKNVGFNPFYAKEMVEKSGQMGVPVIDIDGQIVVGFQPEVFKELLQA